MDSLDDWRFYAQQVLIVFFFKELNFNMDRQKVNFCIFQGSRWQENTYRER